MADLPPRMTQLAVKSRQDLLRLLRLAEEIEENTPYSFKQLDELKCLFVRQQDPGSLKRVCQSLESLSCMPLLPAELFFYSFPGEIECPNPDCANSLTWRKDKLGEYFPLVPSTKAQVGAERQQIEMQNQGDGSGNNTKLFSQPASSEGDRTAGL